MSIRGEVEYKVFEHVENVALLQELRTGEPAGVEIDDAEAIGFLTQLLLGTQDGLFLLADHVDRLARELES
jgi:hypothetical protein